MLTAPLLVDSSGIPIVQNEETLDMGEQIEKKQPMSPVGNNEIAIPEYGREDLEEEDDDYDSEDDSEGHGRVNQAMLDEIHHIINNITEDRFEENFKERFNQMVADVDSLKSRFPPDLCSYEYIKNKMDDLSEDCEGIRMMIDRTRDDIDRKIRQLENEISEEKEN
jgi:hypothetical protein